jgi:hypothetical protein
MKQQKQKQNHPVLDKQEIEYYWKINWKVLWITYDVVQ